MHTIFALLIVLILGALLFFTTLLLLVRDRRLAVREYKSSDLRIRIHRIEEKLNGVRWFSEMLLSDDYGKLNASQEEFAREIAACAEAGMHELRTVVQTDVVQLKIQTASQKGWKKKKGGG